MKIDLDLQAAIHRAISHVIDAQIELERFDLDDCGLYEARYKLFQLLYLKDRELNEEN